MAKDLFSVENKVVVITGGTGVLGTVMANALYERGSKVVVMGLNMEDPESTKINPRQISGILNYDGNVLQEDSMKAIQSDVLKRFGQIDILINAAGGNMPGATIPPEKSFLDLSVPDLQKVLELNYLGTVIPSQVFLEPMMEKKAGNIVNISSMSAQRPLTRVMGYSSAKAAIDNYTQWLAVELATKHGEAFRVNAMAPGFFLTKQNEQLLTNKDGSYTDRANQIINNTPFRRFGVPEELIGTLVWLCSDASKFVTGTIVPIDGGFNAFSGV